MDDQKVVRSTDEARPNIPASAATVDVHIIDTTARIGNIAADLLVEPVIGSLKTLPTIPAFSFLVENKPLQHVQRIKERKWSVKAGKDVSEILQEHGVNPSSIEAIIWSHSHWDHIGDPSTFPHTTELVVGPGFKNTHVPGYPTNPDGRVHGKAYTGRSVREISFAAGPHCLKLGRFDAYDYFGDGSFYLLDAPGHDLGHLCALARTTVEPPTFLLLGADAAHHGGEYRPSLSRPLPENVVPSPLEPLPGAMHTACPSECFIEMHPNGSVTEPYYQPCSGHNIEDCGETIQKMQELDAQDNVMCIIAHDAHLLDIVDCFPSIANDWKAKDWKLKGFWRFLGDFISKEGS